MSSLNGRKMKLGDVVYDVLKGIGQVVRDGGGTLNVVVRFREGDELSYAQDGTFQGEKRLYWKPPYILEPRGPNDKAYDDAIALITPIYNKLVEREAGNQ